MNDCAFFVGDELFDVALFLFKSDSTNETATDFITFTEHQIDEVLCVLTYCIILHDYIIHELVSKLALMYANVFYRDLFVS